jgi:hypothetical protein
MVKLTPKQQALISRVISLLQAEGLSPKLAPIYGGLDNAAIMLKIPQPEPQKQS